MLTYTYFEVKVWVTLSHYLKIWHDTHRLKSLWDIRQKHWTMKYRSQWSTFILRSNVGSYWLIYPKVWCSYIKQSSGYKTKSLNNRLYRSQGPTFILRSNVMSYLLVIPKDDVHISNYLLAMRQNHWVMKYRSQWPIFILRSKVGSYWLLILKYDVHT